MAILNTLAEWIQQNLVVNINQDEATLTVDFPDSIEQWHDAMELANFVAELFPVRDWISTGVSPYEGGFQVALWWSAEEEDEEKTYGDDGNLYLEKEGCERLANLIGASLEDIADEDGDYKIIRLSKDLFRLFGHETLTTYIDKIIPGWGIMDYYLSEIGDSYQFTLTPKISDEVPF